MRVLPRALRLYKYHCFSLWNWRTHYLGRFVEPVAYFVFLVAGLRASVVVPGMGFVRFAVSGMVCFLAFRAATAAVSDVANDRKWGVFALYTLPGGGVWGYLVSIVVFAATMFVAQFLVLVVMAWLIFGSPVIAGGLAGCGVIGLLIVTGWTGVGAAVGAKVQSYATRDMIVVLTSLPVVLSAPLFYPLTSAPRYLQLIAAVNPLSYQVGWVRHPSGVTVLCAGVWALLGYAAGGVVLATAERVTRER